MRIYAETSLFGGVFDQEFQHGSLEFIREVHLGRFELFSSVLVERELLPAPPWVRQGYEATRKFLTVLNSSVEAEALRDAYLSHGVVGRKSFVDAWHIGIATVSGCPVIASWNFQHMVNFQKIPLYNAVNRLRGYGEIEIIAPPEVIQSD